MGGPVKQAEFALLPVLEYKYDTLIWEGPES